MVISSFGGDINTIHASFSRFALRVTFSLSREYCIHFFFRYGDFVSALGLGSWSFHGCGLSPSISSRGDVFFFL